MSSARRISECDNLKAERARGGPNLVHFQHGGGVADIDQDRQTAKTGNDFAQEFDTFAATIGRLQRQAGDVAARPRQTGDGAGAERVRRQREHDRDGRCRLRCGGECISARDDDIDLEPDELGRDLGEALGATLPPAILDGDGTSIDPPELPQPLHQHGEPLAVGCRSARHQEPDCRQLRRLLRVRRKRPSDGRAAEQRDELAPLHSMTSSARPSSGIGTVRPSALAVLRLMTSVYFSACCTGRSLGLAPLRMRST